MQNIVKAFRRPRRFARATGTAASQGFRAASPVARGAPHRHAMRSWPKTLGSRLYESILRTFGISWWRGRNGLGGTGGTAQHSRRPVSRRFFMMATRT